MKINEALDPGGNTASAEVEPVMLGPDAIIGQLRALIRQIPEFGHLPQATRAELQGAVRADPRFVQAAINAVGASDVVQHAVGRSPDELRLETDAAERWTAVEAEARALLEGVAAANLTRRHRVALAALQAYSISRQLVRQDAHSDLLPHVAEMRRLNRFGRRRAQKADPAPQPAPAPPPIVL